jgi:hypothetical protein
MAYEDELSDDVAYRNSRRQSYANSTQSAQDMAYAERVAALEEEKKNKPLLSRPLPKLAAMQDAVAKDAAASKVYGRPWLALPKATQNNEQQDRNSLGRQYLFKSLALGSERSRHGCDE